MNKDYAHSMHHEKTDEIQQHAFERFRLTLTHEYIDDEGVSHKLDLPLTVTQVVEHHVTEKYGAAVFLNEMLDRMKEAVLKNEGT